MSSEYVRIYKQKNHSIYRDFGFEKNMTMMKLILWEVLLLYVCNFQQSPLESNSGYRTF